MICIDCKNKCNEYLSNFISDKANWEWTRKMDKCELDKIVDRYVIDKRKELTNLWKPF